MGKKAFILVLISLLGMASINAQINYSKRKAPPTEHKKIKNPHWKYSDYQPEVNKKIKREQKSALKDINDGSYRKKNLSKEEKRKLNETKVKNKRLDRIKDSKSTHLKREDKINRRNADNNYSQREDRRAQKVNQNKRNFGTREMRRKTRTQKIFDQPPFSKRVQLPS